MGGARNLGAMQVGMLRALLDHDIVPDFVAGCSVGAINGAVIAATPKLDGARQLESIWLEVARNDLWPGPGPGSLMGLFRRRVSLAANDGLRRLVEAHLPDRFEDLAVPFACVAASLATGSEHWFDAGPLADAVLASAAVPGLLPPVIIDGEALIDGAAVDVVPLGRALTFGAQRIFVMQIKDTDTQARPPARPIDVVLQAFAVARNARYVRELAAIPADVEVHVLPVVDWPRFRYDGFARTAELIEAARAAADAYLVGRVV